MVSDTYSPACMQRRDRYMVDHAMLLIAAFDGTAGGTRYTVEYALRRGNSRFLMCRSLWNRYKGKRLYCIDPRRGSSSERARMV